MPQVPILSGIYADSSSQLRTSLPRNLVPVPKQSGISTGYLGPSSGLTVFGTGPGVDRGGINWNGALYRVMGTKLVRVTAGGGVTILGDVGLGGPVSMDYSFDRLAIASNRHLYYWDGTALTMVTDPDLGVVVDMLWVDGYFMTTDGEFLVVTELNDPYSVDPLKYGSSEVDPDPVVALKKVRNEIKALNRYTVESFQNVGGSGFPFARIDGAQLQRGCVGTHACCVFAETIAFLGSGRNEAPSIYLGMSGSTQKIATREIDTILLTYTEAQLSTVILEAKVDKAHNHLLVHLPDQTLVFDAAATAAIGDAVWFTYTSSIVGKSQYRAQNLVWCYDQWTCGDPQTSNLGKLVDDRSTHYDQVIGWEFGTPIIYNESNGALVHSMELVGLPGSVQFGLDPTIWTSYSLDGQKWSQERPIQAGKAGETLKRLCWRQQGKLRNWRIQKFRGTSDAHLGMIRLEMGLEPLGV